MNSLVRFNRRIACTLFCLMLLSMALHAQTYRYVKFTVTSSGGGSIHELSWISSGQEYPLTAMTSNNSAGAVTEGWEAYRAYDDNFSTAIWVDGTATNQEFKLDFGSEPITPTGIIIQKEGWDKLYGFKCEGSNDNTAWDLLYSKSLTPDEQEFPNKTGIFLFQPDTQAPHAPASVTAGEITQSSVQLSWEASTDNTLITGYEIFRGDVSMGKTKNTSFQINNLTPGTTYTFTVKAQDAAGNQSQGSIPVIATTESSGTVAAGYRYVRFVVENNTSGLGIEELEFFNGNNTYPKLPIISAGGSLEALMTPGYAYRLFDKKSDGEWIGGTPGGEQTFMLDFKDRVIYPTAVKIRKQTYSNLKEFRVEGTNDLNTSWSTLFESPSNMDNTHFEEGTTGTFIFGTSSVPVDDLPPSAPSPVIDYTTHNSAKVSWASVTDDQSAVKGYGVYLNGVLQDFSENTFFRITSVLSPQTQYNIEVVAYDSEFNSSAKGSVTITTQAPPVAEGYKYLRAWLTQNPNGQQLQVVEIRWLMGEKRFPLTPLRAPNGSTEVEIFSSNENINNFDGPYKSFDGQTDTHWYAEQGKEVTLNFKNLILYPTGIEFTHYNWNNIVGFRCEGSNDNENWTVLYERSNLSSTDFSVINDRRVGKFDFGTLLPPDLDTTAPSIPENIQASEIKSTNATLSWNESTDQGTGVSAYKIFVNGVEWGNSTAAEFTVYGLSPQTNYTIAITAADKLGNESVASVPFTLSTIGHTPSKDAMVIGSDFGDNTQGMWKQNVDFAHSWANYATSNPFSETFLEEIKHYKVLRFMGLVNTNNNWIANWSDRRQPDDQDQTSPQNWDKNNHAIVKGVAVEWLIKLCNLNKSDLWINIPHAATDDYIQQLAALIKQHLDPALNVCIEYSNEVWAGFGSETFATEQGRALGLHQGNFKRYAWFTEDFYARFRFYVYRSTQIYDMFNIEFASDSIRVKKVLSGWAGQQDLTRVHMDALTETQINPKGIYPDFYAIAPYFAGDVNGSSPTLLQDLLASAASTEAGVKGHYSILSSYNRNIPLITYEGGQHVVNGGELASRNPVMHQAYMQYLDAIAPYIKQFQHFIHFGPYGWGMAWGSKEYVGQPELTSFKYRALKDWAAANINTPEVKAPLILDDVKDQSVTEGSGALFELAVIGEQPVAYQWFKNGVAIEGATGSQLQLKQLSLSQNSDQYSVLVTNAHGSTSSRVATLTVTEGIKAIAQKTVQSIMIDGMAEAAWDNLTPYSMSNVSLGSVTNDADLSGSFKTMWDSTYLYVLVKVTDNVLVPVENPASPWNYDGVEIYIDATNDKSTSYDANDRQMVFTWNATQILGGSGNLSFQNAKASQVTLSDGYQTEFAFAWSDLGIIPQAGHYFGLDVMVADNDSPGGNREGKKAWWATEDQSWSNPGLFGTAMLEETLISPLQLVSACSFIQGKSNWQIINPNDSAVAYTWQVNNATPVSALAEPGENLLTTVQASGNLTITWSDESDQQQSVSALSLPTTGEPKLPVVNESGKPVFLWPLVWIDESDKLNVALKGKNISLSNPSILFILSKQSSIQAPVDGTAYTDGGVYGQNGIAYIVHPAQNGYLFSKDVELVANTTYRLDIYLFNKGTACGPNYGNSAIFSTTFKTPSGVQIKIYPNPAGDEFTVHYKGQSDHQTAIRIVNTSTGETKTLGWSVKKGDNQITLSTQGLSNGIYILSLQSEEKLIKERLIIRK